ncbi:TonB-system energizer ExbB [Desulfuromonas acetoxidans]|uniref:MotA/TolQ/ExbB proton channel n=1 Tax=Desulfuromonas acetoxidans (strain DSM 684 / 11070) TaxID=281689 RepID=Q1K0D1_DESA6|nr:TonB-system energizer ExbB [Desulfuromonas acetoxidans]EAT16010.1 MotA/TolQ/ExbB proton channel [Desulfuromonas acetoxidans DSM 684]MBF0644092.1 TonB-system energizer ExbB [Desulfuromonas acetoxidans]NVD24609.1 TonB-system energizer ExbB [Desulfuromonas acetoxidans]NVE16441.1 TonB-system energizer ExbB [Desulfuromonas acetoxidans]
MDWLKQTIDLGVIGVLVTMSIIALSVILERALFYRQLTLTDYTSKKALELALTRRLHIIATIGSNAPFIGLLGTVLGIMLTFYTMGQQGAVDTHAIMTGLALALKVTAIGLVIAIPTVAFYNVLIRRAKEMLLEWEIHHEREGI